VSDLDQMQSRTEPGRLRSETFRARREADWSRFEKILQSAEKNSGGSLSLDDILEAPVLYRSTLSSLSIARETSLDQSVIGYLESLSARGYFFLYSARASLWEKLGTFFAVAWPRAAKAVWKETLAAGAFMILGAAIAILLMMQDPEWFFTFVPEGLAGGRDPAASQEFLRGTLGHEDGSGGLAAFAAFLFSNNAGVALMAFALGFAFGIPTVLLLTYNGATLGAMLFVFFSKGLGFEFTGWLLIHGVTELLAIVLAGAAGLKIGMASLYPGEQSRLDSMSQAGKTAGAVVAGVVLMLILAGLLEGFGRQLITSEAGRYGIAALTGLTWALYLYAPRKRTSDAALG
jgi:uncharacterized membrane protein SpoIIM required for sporulation